ncbi:MAG: CoB--CoM heterodisulfide reductase iron-sulfur subunit A family protein [Desulfomonile tiedjei]|nr:CoB--CoM heterodisulfide reductase iron-sulfur subunit A family protein [Desulfomonile tiedjei]
METDALIVGAGVAGLWSAWELALHGATATIVEAAPYPGGHVARFCCKATGRCQKCGACLLEDVLRKVRGSDRITTLLGSTVLEASDTDRGFDLTLLCRPPRIFPDRCDGCGACTDVCPVPGALVQSPFDRRMVLDQQRCLRFQGGECRACEEACTRGAVNLDMPAQKIPVSASAVVLAAGFRPFDPLEKPRLGYGRVPGVVTAAELDELIRTDKWFPGAGASRTRSVAFIQCVGSRDAKIGRNYCSRVCCGYALRLARLLRSRYPDIEPTMFYMDIQSFERDFEARLGEAAREARLIRSMPAEIRTGSDGRPEVVYEGMDEKRVAEPYDMVVLSVGISPGQSLGNLCSTFGIDLNSDGFLGPDGEAVTTSQDGLFVAGAVQAPRSIEDSVSHAIKAAAAADRYLRRMANREKQ